VTTPGCPAQHSLPFDRCRGVPDCTSPLRDADKAPATALICLKS
jgi:hypothetical protein